MVDLTPLVLQSRPCSSKIFNHPVTNNASLSLSNFSYQSTSSTLLHDPLSSSSKQCQSFSNSSYLLISSLLLQDPHSSKILTPPRSSLLQDPHSFNILTPQRSSFIKSQTMLVCLCQTPHIYINLAPTPPRSSIIK